MNSKKDTSRTTILIISMGFLLLFILFSWRWALYISFIVGIIGVFSQVISSKIEWGWMKMSIFLGYIIPNILLTLVFFLFLFPISLLYKLSRKDPLMLSRNYKTYFISIDKVPDKKDLEKTW
jgi:hypothetical protein